jgi:hypothetical protein
MSCNGRLEAPIAWRIDVTRSETFKASPLLTVQWSIIRPIVDGVRYSVTNVVVEAVGPERRGDDRQQDRRHARGGRPVALRPDQVMREREEGDAQGEEDGDEGSQDPAGEGRRDAGRSQERRDDAAPGNRCGGAERGHAERPCEGTVCWRRHRKPRLTKDGLISLSSSRRFALHRLTGVYPPSP